MWVGGLGGVGVWEGFGMWLGLTVAGVADP